VPAIEIGIPGMRRMGRGDHRNAAPGQPARRDAGSATGRTTGPAPMTPLRIMGARLLAAGNSYPCSFRRDFRRNTAFASAVIAVPGVFFADGEK